MTRDEARAKCIEVGAAAAANRYWSMPGKEFRPSDATWENCNSINKATWREIFRAGFDALNGVAIVLAVPETERGWVAPDDLTNPSEKKP